MTQRALKCLARLLWPHIWPYVQDALAAHETQAHARIAAKADAAADRKVKRYIGEP